MNQNQNTNQNGPTVTELVGELYQGSEIHFRADDARVNITEMCGVFGRRPNDFLALQSTIDYIAALEESLIQLPGNPVIKAVETKTGRHGSGTWAHPNLGMECARWLSPEFSIWCNEKILRILRGEVVGGPVMDRAEAEARAAKFQAEAARLEAEVVRQKLLARRALDLLGGIHVADHIAERNPNATPLEIARASAHVRSYAYRHGHRIGKRYRRQSSRMVPVYHPQTIAEALADWPGLGGKTVLSLPATTT